MKFLPFFFLLFLTGISVFSCTVERRIYKRGFHFEWKNNYGKSSGDKTSPVVLRKESPALELKEEKILHSVPVILNDSVLIVDNVIVSERKSPLAISKIVKLQLNEKQKAQMPALYASKLSHKAKQQKEDHSLLIVFILGALILGALLGFGIWALIALENPLLGIVLLSVFGICVLFPVISAIGEASRIRQRKKEAERQRKQEEIQKLKKQ